KIGKPLKDWNIKIFRGVLTGFNEAFIIDENKKNELINADPKNAEIIKPILRGRDIKKYYCKFENLYLIYSHSDIKKNDYPEIKKYLSKYKQKLLKRRGGMNKKTFKLPYKWWQLQVDYYSSGTFKNFEKEKIIYSNMAQEFEAYYDNNKLQEKI
ncbi:MAG: hypothetical protein B6I24_06565, partial [Bacteroidetes bacterium 4572_128]